MTLASANPAARVIDLVDLARGAIARLAREQDAARFVMSQGYSNTTQEAHAAALATSRGEAARAVQALFDALPDEDMREGTAEDLAGDQLVALNGSAPIPSATLREWETAWGVYAETLADAPEGSETPPMPLPTPDGVVMP